MLRQRLAEISTSVQWRAAVERTSAMLVLSRRLHEKLVFPGIDTRIEVLSIKGNLVRLGIEAPPQVKVLREELAANQPAALEGPQVPEGRFPALLRQLADRLTVTARSLGTIQLLLDAGQVDDARTLLACARDDFQVVRFGLAGELGEAPSPPACPPRHVPRALLVEDDRNQRELLAGFLRMAGLDVDTAGDGSDALDYLHSRPRPDVVLLDMGLPRCDGATTVRSIRQDPSLAGLRIVAVTGSAPEEFDLAQGPGGVDRWFRKPLDPASLLRDLQQELSHPSCLV